MNINYVENDNKGFDVLSGNVKICEITYAQILALAPVAVNRAPKVNITNEDVLNERWNIATKLM